MKILILMTTVYAVVMMLHWPIGFTMFTQLSNLFVAVVVACQLCRRPMPLVKLSATVSILVTFGVYLLVLAPLQPGGMLAAYRQDHWASLCFHVLTPAFTLCDFILHDAPAHPWRWRDAWAAMVPPCIWFALIVLLGQFGFRWWGMAAPYLFLNYTAPAGWFGFLPETAGTDTLGIGVAYVLAVLVPLFLVIGLGLVALGRWRSAAEKDKPC